MFRSKPRDGNMFRQPRSHPAPTAGRTNPESVPACRRICFRVADQSSVILFHRSITSWMGVHFRFAQNWFACQPLLWQFRSLPFATKDVAGPCLRSFPHSACQVPRVHAPSLPSPLRARIRILGAFNEETRSDAPRRRGTEAFSVSGNSFQAFTFLPPSPKSPAATRIRDLRSS